MKDFSHIYEMLEGQIEKLSNDSLCNTEAKIKNQVERTSDICELTGQIVSLTNTQIKALEVKDRCEYAYSELPKQIGLGSNKI